MGQSVARAQVAALLAELATRGRAPDSDAMEERITLDEGTSGRIDRALADRSTLSRERVKALIRDGRVVRFEGGEDEVVRDPAAAVRPGVWVLDVPRPATLDAQPQAIALDIVHEDADLIVVDKPAGLVVHPGAGHPDGTLVNALLHHCAGQLSGIGGVERPGIVHRIDKDTSGLLVVAKSDRAHEGLSRQFAAHTVERRYDLLVAGRPLPPGGTVDAPLGRSERDRTAMTVVAAGRGKRAVTHYRTVAALAGSTRMECRLETGRTHQVRVHMAHLGHPLVGDPVYGRRGGPLALVLNDLAFCRQALHAATLGFTHPGTGQDVRFEAPIPRDMQELFMALKL